jgi:CspA family cold shock protein
LSIFLEETPSRFGVAAILSVASPNLNRRGHPSAPRRNEIAAETLVPFADSYSDKVHCSQLRGAVIGKFMPGDFLPTIHGKTDMPEGTIKKVLDKGFGFISIGGGKDLFFHSSAVQGVRFEELQVGQKVTYTEGQGPKGPCAENVKPA